MCDQFGVTLHGYTAPIGKSKRDDFSEPRLVSYVPKKPKPEDRAWSFPKGLDVYDLVLDGHSYSSQHLLQQIKHKKFVKPFGASPDQYIPHFCFQCLGYGSVYYVRANFLVPDTANGPADVYRMPLASSMEVGWFLKDPALEGQDWMQVRTKSPWPWSEMTRFLDHIRRVDKFCNM